MAKYANKIVKNRPSPKNESSYIEAYKQANPSAKKADGKDISAVTTKSGEKGHALLKQSVNRGKDNNYHIGEDFISDKELRQKKKK